MSDSDQHTVLRCPQRERIAILESSMSDMKRIVEENDKLLIQTYAKVTNGLESKVNALWKLMWAILLASVLMPWVKGLVEGAFAAGP